MSEMSKINIVDLTDYEYEDSEIEKIIKESLEDQKLKDIIKSAKRVNESDTSFIKRNIEKFGLCMSSKLCCKNCPGKVSDCDFGGRTYGIKLYNGNTLISEHKTCPISDKATFELLNQMKYNFVVNDLEERFDTANPEKLKSSPDREPYFKWFKEAISSKGPVNKPFVYVTGGASGRTYIAATFANWVVNKELGKAAFVNCSTTSSSLQNLSMTNRQAFIRIINDLCKCKILVLDGFGSEYTNAFVRDAIWFEILRKRASAKRMTIINSDYQYYELKENYSEGGRAKFKAQQLVKLIEINAGTPIQLNSKENSYENKAN